MPVLAASPSGLIAAVQRAETSAGTPKDIPLKTDWYMSIISRRAGADSETCQMSTGDRRSRPRRRRTNAP